MKRIFICSGLFLLLIMNLVNAGTIIRWDEAHKYYGQTVTVEGKIVATYNSGKACFLNFHPDYKIFYCCYI